MTQPILKYQRLNGLQLAYFEWGSPQPQKPSLYFVHATGFHGRVWDAIVAAFGDYHVVALEQRGHGRSDKRPITTWRDFGDDQVAFLQALGLRNVIGIGHSMGAHGLIDAAAGTGACHSLLLLDPTVAAPEAYLPGGEGTAELPQILSDDQLHPAARRRRLFSSVDEMVEQIRVKSSFPLFQPRILRDYCEYGLLPCEGGYELACPPELEARVYMSSRTNAGVYDSVRSLSIPATVMRAKLPDPAQPGDFSASPTWPGLAGEFKHAKDIHLPECSHFIPMQVPDLVIAELEALITQWSQPSGA
ncbi:MAG: alpha/beta hydrolase [Pseudomonadota bacterium]